MVYGKVLFIEILGLALFGRGDPLSHVLLGQVVLNDTISCLTIRGASARSGSWCGPHRRGRGSERMLSRGGRRWELWESALGDVKEVGTPDCGRQSRVVAGLWPGFSEPKSWVLHPETPHPTHTPEGVLHFPHCSLVALLTVFKQQPLPLVSYHHS